MLLTDLIRYFKPFLLTLKSQIASVLNAYPETWLFILFSAGSLFIDTNKLYLLMVVLFYLVNCLIIKDIVRATWFTFFSLFLFNKVKSFDIDFGNPSYYAQILNLPRTPIISYFVSYADAWLVLLLYLVLFRLRSLFYWGKIGKIDLLVLFLVILGGAASYFSPLAGISWFWFLQFVKYIIFFYLARIIGIYHRKIISATLIVLLLFCLLNATLIVYQKYRGGPVGLVVEVVADQSAPYGDYADESRSLYRPAGIYWDSNLAATFLAVVLPLSVMLTLNKGSRFNRVMALGMTAGLSLALILTASRAVWLSAALTIVVLVLWLKQRQALVMHWLSRRNKLILAGISLVAAGPFVTYRLSTLSSAFGAQGSFQYRWHQFLMTKDVMITHFFGVGLNTFKYFVLDKYTPTFYFSDVSSPHNFFAEIGASLGILGLLMMCYLIMEIAFEALHLLRAKVLLLPAGERVFVTAIPFCLLAYLLCSQFYPWVFSPVISGIVWILAGLLYAYRDIKKNQKTTNY